MPLAGSILYATLLRVQYEAGFGDAVPRLEHEAEFAQDWFALHKLGKFLVRAASHDMPFIAVGLQRGFRDLRIFYPWIVVERAVITM